MKINREINLTEDQHEFCASNKTLKVMVGGTGCGKSYVAIVNLLAHVLDNSKSLSVVIMPDYSAIKNIACILVDEILPKEAVKSYNRIDRELQFINGSKIIFVSAASPKAIQHLYNLPISSFWIDNGDMVDESIWSTLVERVKQNGTPYLGIITSTPSRGWMYQKFYINKDKLSDDYLIMDNIGTKSNTFLPDEYVKTLEHEYHGKHAEQEIEGLW